MKDDKLVYGASWQQQGPSHIVKQPTTMEPAEELKMDLTSLLRSSTMQEQYVGANELARIIFEARKDASRIAEVINELEKEQ